MLHLLGCLRQALRFERLILGVQFLHLVEPNLHPYEAFDVCSTCLLLTPDSKHSNEICKPLCQPQKDLVEALREKLSFNHPQIVVESSVDRVDKIGPMRYSFTLAYLLNNSILLLKISIFDLGNILECLKNQLLQVFHIDGLKLHQSELNLHKVLHRDSQLCLDIFTSPHKLVENQDCLRFGLDDLFHTIHIVVDALHDHLLVALDIKVHNLEVWRKAWLDAIGNVLQVSDELLTYLEDLLELLSVTSSERDTLKGLSNSHFNRLAKPVLTDDQWQSSIQS